MNKKSPKPAKQPQEEPQASAAAADESALLPADEFWEENKSKILAGVILVLVVAFSSIGWAAWRQGARNAAASAFMTAGTPEEWAEVARKFAGTPAAQNSGLLLAAALRENGDAAASDTAYNSVLRESRDFGLQAAAALGVAENALAASGGEAEPAALAALQAVAARFPDSYAAPFALYTEGDTLARAKKEAEAVRVFRNLLADYPNSISGRLASMQIQKLAPALEAAAAHAADKPQEPAARTESEHPAGDAAPESSPAD